MAGCEYWYMNIRMVVDEGQNEVLASYVRDSAWPAGLACFVMIIVAVWIAVVAVLADEEGLKKYPFYETLLKRFNLCVIFAFSVFASAGAGVALSIAINPSDQNLFWVLMVVPACVNLAIIISYAAVHRRPPAAASIDTYSERKHFRPKQRILRVKLPIGLDATKEVTVTLSQEP